MKAQLANAQFTYLLDSIVRRDTTPYKRYEALCSLKKQAPNLEMAMLAEGYIVEFEDTLRLVCSRRG